MELKPPGGAAGTLEGRRLLVVEDDAMVAELVCEMLETEGAEVVGPVGSVNEALTLLDRAGPRIDLALLDVNLRGETSYPIADRLGRAGIPYVFASGYGTDQFDPRFRQTPRCEKPFRHDELIAALLVGAAARSAR